MPTYIRTTRTASDGTPSTRRLDRPALSESVEFDDDGRAEVSDDDASTLLDLCPYLERDDAICSVTLESGEACGRDRPCQYHDDDDDEGTQAVENIAEKLTDDD